MIAVKYPMCKIDCDLNWPLQTNLLLIRQREPGVIIDNIEINCDDAYISDADVLTDLFKNHKHIKKMTLENVYDVRDCVDNILNPYVDSVEIVVLSGINMVCLRSILDIVNKKRLCALKIIYKPKSIEICILNLKMFFKNLLERQDEIFLLSYIEIVVDFSTTIIDTYMNFEKYTELVGYIEKVLIKQKIQLLKFNHKFVRLNTNWKNDIYQYFLF